MHWQVIRNNEFIDLIVRCAFSSIKLKVYPELRLNNRNLLQDLPPSTPPITAKKMQAKLIYKRKIKM